MADTKISAFGSGSPVVGTDELVIARGGSNYKVTPANLLTYINSQNITSKTTAQMQALAGSFIPGHLYLITDANSGSLTWQTGLLVQAMNADMLYITGEGAFQNGVMGDFVYGIIDYNLTTDTVQRVAVPFYPDGTFCGNVMTNYSYNGYAAFPWDNTGVSNNYMDDPQILNLTTTTFIANKLGFQCTLDITENAVMTGTDVGPGCGIVMNQGAGAAPSVIQSCRIDNLTNISAMKGCSLIKCRFGPNKEFSTADINPDYSATGKVYDGNISTFEMTNAFCSLSELDMGANLGIINVLRFAWAGILWVTADNVTALDNVTNMNSDHNITLKNNGAANGFVINDTTIAAGNIYLETTGSTITIDSTNYLMDFLEIAYLDVNNVCQVASTVRI